MANYFRNYRLLLYPDNDKHQMVMLSIDLAQLQYVRCLHDKDDKQDGEEAKPHYHYVVTFKDAKTISAAQAYFERMGLEKRFVWAITSALERKQAIRYLLHLDDPDKYQYPLESAEGPMKPVLSALAVSREDENARVLGVLDLVASYGRSEISYTSFVRKACEADLWGTLRHMGQWGVKIVDEHNNGLFREYHLDV